MAKQHGWLALIGFLVISSTASGQAWREGVGARFENTQNSWLDKATLAKDGERSSSACSEAERFNRSYDVVRNFFHDPKSFSDDILMNTKIKLHCDCARWIVTKQRADWQDVLDYAGLPRCGKDSARRECLPQGAEGRACAENENPFPYKNPVASP